MRASGSVPLAAANRAAHAPCCPALVPRSVLIPTCLCSPHLRLQRPSGEAHAVQRPAGLSTPSSATLACSGGMHTPASAPASAAQPWQQLQGPVSPAPQIVVRQLSLPSHPPSPLLLAGSTSPAAAAPADELWAAVPPATLAAQLAPSLPFYECSQVAARCEAERQLTLLQQLKASMAVGGSSAAASSCGSLSGGGLTQTEVPPMQWLPGGECCAC